MLEKNYKILGNIDSEGYFRPTHVLAQRDGNKNVYKIADFKKFSSKELDNIEEYSFD